MAYKKVKALMERSKARVAIVHGGEVQKVPGDAVYLPDKKMCENSLPDLGHHLLEFWPVSIFPGVACILEYHIIVRVQNEGRIRDQVFFLHWQRIFIYLV